MKKVRYAIGALGVAPALGLMMPAANAAAAGVHAPKNAAKTVSLEHSKTPLTDCGSNHIQAATSTGGHLHGAIKYSGACVHSQWASLNRDQTGLVERVRFYSGNGALERTTWQGGRIYSSVPQTFFASVPNSNAHKVCQALVAASNHNKVKYGPVCEAA